MVRQGQEQQAGAGKEIIGQLLFDIYELSFGYHGHHRLQVGGFSISAYNAHPPIPRRAKRAGGLRRWGCRLKLKHHRPEVGGLLNHN